MKIVLINTLYPPSKVGGAERSVQILAEELVNHGHEIVSISLGTEDKLETINQVKIYRLKLKNIYWPFDASVKDQVTKAIWHIVDTFNELMKNKVRGILLEESPDLIHTHNLQGFSTKVWELGKVFNLPVVHTLRDYWLRCPKTTMYKDNQECASPCLGCKALSLPKKYMSGRVDAVIGISQFILENHLEAGFFPNAIETKVIHNSLFIEENQTLSEAAVNDQPFTAGFLGRISRSKGIKELVHIFMSTEIPLLIGGKGNKNLEEFITDISKQNIHLMGYVNPDQFFKQIDLLIVPSRWNEPFGRVVIEAYSHGIPVIVSNRGGLPEIVEEGKTGYIAEINEQAVIPILEKLKNNSRLLDKLKSNALRKSEEFSIDSNIYKKHIDIYTKLIN